MKKAGFFMALTLIVIAMFFVSCEEEKVTFDSDHIINVAMTNRIDDAYRPQKVTYTFDTDTPRIYCTFQVVDVPAGTSVSAEWIYVRGTTGVENYFIGDLNKLIEGNQNTAMFINRPAKGWPPGEYQVNLYIDGDLQGSVPFQVK